MTEADKLLIEAIAAAFKHEKFDTTSIIFKADDDMRLAEAIEAAVPDCRYRSNWLEKGRFKKRSLQRVLQPLSNRHFVTDNFGWWSVKNEAD
jgi:hypothetical protein